MKKRLLYLTLIAATLSIGVIVGTIVSGGVKATVEQQRAATLSIPDPVSLSNAFSQISAQIDGAVVRIDTESMVAVPTPRVPQQRNPQGPGGGGGGRRGGGGGGQAQPPQLPDDLFGGLFGGGADQGATRKAESVGTGFIVDKAGFILTNHHVIEDATKITVVLEDKSEHPAKLIGSDEKTDLAVIKIDVAKDLPVAKLGNSDAVKTGDWVLAIGSPFGFDHTVTAGIISAKGRPGGVVGASDPNNPFQSFLQTDAAINPGNSGGPLVSMSGEVIGVNTAIVSETRGFSGLGFALPSNTAINIYNQLVTAGKVTRGSIGITYKDDPALLRPFGQKAGDGVLVTDVLAGKPAAKAGLMERDIITQIDGKKISSGEVLLDVIANTVVGRTLQFKLLRDGRELTVPVVVGDRAEIIPDVAANVTPPPPVAASSQARLGVSVQPMTNQIMRSFGLSKPEGVVISKVEPGSVAENAELREGMVITQITSGGQKLEIRTVDDFTNAMKAFKSGTELALRVLISGQEHPNFVPITVP
jgi:serine protease Do